MIKEFVDLLDQMKAIHEKKNQDYAERGHDFQNFERSAEISNWFAAPIDKVYITLITTKLARLATLLNNSGHTPNNESIDDSFLDLSTYTVLWAANRQRIKKDIENEIGKQENVSTVENQTQKMISELDARIAEGRIQLENLHGENF